MDECIHGLGPVSACVICNGHEQAERRAAHRVVRSISAQFDSTLRCGHDAQRGDVICQRANEEWICADCAVMAPHDR